MINLAGKAKETRCAFLVVADEKYMFITRGGDGCIVLDDTYKNTTFIHASISLELFNKLKGGIAFIGEVK